MISLNVCVDLVEYNIPFVQIENEVGLSVAAVPVDECSKEMCWESGCTNSLVTTENPVLVNSETESLVGVNTYVEPVCECAARGFDMTIQTTQKCTPMACLNNGICIETWNDYEFVAFLLYLIYSVT